MVSTEDRAIRPVEAMIGIKEFDKPLMECRQVVLQVEDNNPNWLKFSMLVRADCQPEELSERIMALFASTFRLEATP